MPRQPTSGGILGTTEPDPDLSRAPEPQPAFDPDKFLKETGDEKFDPDKFLKDTAPESKTYAFGRGAVQGALYDIPEAIGQIFEHATGLNIPIPPNVRNWFYDVRQKTEETGAGQAGRLTGGIASLLVAPEAMIGARAAATAARAGYSAELARAAKTAQAATKTGKAAARTRAVEQIAERAGARLPPAGPAAIRAAEERAAAEAEAAGLPRSPNVERTQGAASVLRSRAAAAAPESRLGRVIGQGAGGAAIGAAQPVEDEQNFARQKAWQAVSGGALGGLVGTRLGDVALKQMRRHPFMFHAVPTAAMIHNPWTAVPYLSALAGLWALRGAERAPVRATTVPIGVGAGQFLRGTPPTSEETPNAETD